MSILQLCNNPVQLGHTPCLCTTSPLGVRGIPVDDLRRLPQASRDKHKKELMDLRRMPPDDNFAYKWEQLIASLHWDAFEASLEDPTGAWFVPWPPLDYAGSARGERPTKRPPQVDRKRGGR